MQFDIRSFLESGRKPFEAHFEADFSKADFGGYSVNNPAVCDFTATLTEDGAAMLLCVRAHIDAECARCLEPLTRDYDFTREYFVRDRDLEDPDFELPCNENGCLDLEELAYQELIPAIAKDYGVDYMDCYTGFKWIANEIREQEGKRRYIGGGEESYGYLWETFVRDKSSVSACAIFAELTAWALDKGLTIDMLLEKIYYEHGYFLEQGVSVVRKGIKGAQEISQMMVDYRSNPVKELAGSPVVKILDYQSLEGKCLKSGKTFPIKMPATSNVLQYHTADGTVLSIRPSGTEPKIKYYIGVTYKRGSDPACDHPEQLLRDRIKAIREQLGI